MENLPEKVDSKFRFVLLAARRAEQMYRGARPRIDLPHQKLTRVAMAEVQQGIVAWDYGPPEQPAAAEDVQEASEVVPEEEPQSEPET